MALMPESIERFSTAKFLICVLLLSIVLLVIAALVPEGPLFRALVFITIAVTGILWTLLRRIGHRG